MPAYEWNFSDVNPPVHAWATLFLYKFEKNLGREDIKFLARSFQGLMHNFNWWLNRKDPQGKNVFAGGFLGLDNIGVFDRSAPLPTEGSLEQADGTAWIAFCCQNMLDIDLILADHDPVYEEVAFKFLENFIWISYAMDKVGEHQDDMWDEEDGFYYDVLRLADGEAFRLKVRSMVGLLPLCASTVFEGDLLTRHPKLIELIALFRKRHPEVLAQVAPTIEGFIGYAGRRLLSPLTRKKLERILGYLLDESEFLSPYYPAEGRAIEEAQRAQVGREPALHLHLRHGAEWLEPAAARHELQVLKERLGVKRRASSLPCAVALAAVVVIAQPAEAQQGEAVAGGQDDAQQALADEPLLRCRLGQGRIERRVLRRPGGLLKGADPR
jgi:hypothetical protein